MSAPDDAKHGTEEQTPIFNRPAAITMRETYLNLGKTSKLAHRFLNDLIADYKAQRQKEMHVAREDGLRHDTVVEVRVELRISVTEPQE